MTNTPTNNDEQLAKVKILADLLISTLGDMKPNEADEVVYRYNLRNAPVFPALIAQACLPVAGIGENRV
ncbi:MAG TPA: hypothetical protein VNG32_00475 [Candidatus Dormibacteraeota bacterium]|nr:hypothetical protein [Candidatus Dormibacteraeota bacterium]